MEISKHYPIDRLTAVLETARGCGLAVPGGFHSVVLVSKEFLTQDDVEIVETFLRGERSKDNVVIPMRGNDGFPILFAEENDAVMTARQQLPHMAKKLLFSIYRKTGIQFSLGASVQFESPETDS